MKKLFLISILMALMFSVKAQVLFPVNQSVGNATTNNLLYTINGGGYASVGFIDSKYADTTAANLNSYLKWYAGARFYSTSDDAVWVRNAAKTMWIKQGTGSGGSGWALTGNAGTTAGVNFLGTTDDVDLVFKSNNLEVARFTDEAINFDIVDAFSVQESGQDILLADKFALKSKIGMFDGTADGALEINTWSAIGVVDFTLNTNDGINDVFIKGDAVANTLRYTAGSHYLDSLVSIGTATPAASSVLDITSTTRGLLIPRMTEAERDAIGSPATSLMIYQTDATAGFYYWNGSAWVAVGGGGTIPISSLTVATGTNSINNANYLQQWAWNSFEANGDPALQLSANTTATVDGSNGLLEVIVQGANAASGVTSISSLFSNTHTGTTSTNIAGYFTSTSGSNNYAIIVPSGGGSVGIGNSAPSSLLSLGTAGSQLGTLSMAGNTSGTVTIQPQAAAGTYNFNLPTTAGTSGYLLTSAGGGASPMTYTDPATFVPSVSIYGEYLTTTFPGASIPSGFVKLDGSATITFNNPSVTITGGDGNKSNNYIRNTDTSSSNNYDYIWDFTLDTKFSAYAGQGKWFGKQSLDNTTIYNGIVYFGYGGSSSLARMKLALPSGTGNGTDVDSSGTISMADGNTYRLTFSQRQNVIYVKLSLLSSGEEIESVYIYYRVSLNANNVLPNLGVAAFGSLDATSEITVTNFSINYNDYVDADAVVIGTSISQGFRTSSMNNTYIEKAFKGSGKTFVNMASGGLNFTDMYALLPRVQRLTPDNFIVEIGVNDNGMAVATFRGHLQQLYDSVVTSYGKTLILVKDFSNATYDTIYYNFAAQNGLTLIDPTPVMSASSYNADGIHPNDLGNDIYASSCKRALPALFGNEVVNDRYSLQGLNDVSISSPTNSQSLTYNSTTGKWGNSTLSGFVTLQPGAITQQTGGFGVTGYGEVGTGLSVGTTNTVGVLFKTYASTVQDATARFENANSASTSSNRYLRISQMGVTAYGIADWPSASVVTSFTNGGLVLGAYHGNVLFQTGTSYTTRANFSANGLYVGGNTAATARLHLAASTTAASSGQIKLAEGSDLTTPEDGNINYVSNNLKFTEGSTVYTLAKTLTNTATLDFGNTAAGVAADLTITVTGAAVGQPVVVGVDNASMSADNIAFWGWVSAVNTVTVRFNNNNLVTAVDPPSGTFRVSVMAY